MKPIDVKKILDIPNIENYIKYLFELDLYERGDRTIFYKCYLENLYEIRIEIVSNESLIIGELDLAEILAHYEIGFFQWTIKDDLGNTKESYMYRPNIDESKKNY